MAGAITLINLENSSIDKSPYLSSSKLTKISSRLRLFALIISFKSVIILPAISSKSEKSISQNMCLNSSSEIYPSWFLSNK